MKNKFQPADAAIKARAKELRQPLIPAERKLWQRLRNRQLNQTNFPEVLNFWEVKTS